MYVQVRDTIACVGFWFALLIGFMGQLVTVHPKSEAGLFGVGAGAAALMLLSARWRVRVVSV